VSLDYALLRSLHRMLKQITDIRSRMERGPIKIRLVKSNEASFLAAMEQAKEQVTKIRMAADAKQMQLSEREMKIKDMEAKLNTCESNREFQLLRDRIAADHQANSVLQDEILEMLERLDVLIAESDAATQHYEKSQEETRRITSEVEAELTQLKSELDRISGDLAEAEKKLPADLIAEYRRLVGGKGEDALGQTDTQTCGNCNQTLTTQTASDLMMKHTVFCKGCGCLLYLPENHPAGRIA
jgi:predicted  nucleic acid-binding Zn-ribbon protein